MAETRHDNSTSDQDLIEATCQGDWDAFEMLIQRYWPLAVALALSRLANTSEAEDVVQESFIRAYEKLNSLRDPCRFVGWLSRIVHQKCVDVYRQQQRQQKALGCAVALEPDLADSVLYSSNPGLSQPQIQLVRQCIGRLPEKFRGPIIMRFVGGLSAVEIARQLGKRPGTIRVWLHRAYEHLRHDLTPLLEEV